jgi:hypothetical protein
VICGVFTFTGGKIMKTEIILICFMLLVFLALPDLTLAEWTEPVPVEEVNTEFPDTRPFLSYDGLTLYFSRNDGLFSIYSATRDEPFGPFTSVELALSSSHHVYGPWVSPDDLRMYYHEEQTSAWLLKMSERASVEDPWPQGTTISELNTLGNIHLPALTADELIIFFASPDTSGGLAGMGEYDIWTASRPDRNSPFGNVRNLTEINTSAYEQGPFVSPDGLKLYFSSNRNASSQIFMATRDSLNQPFGNVEHLSFFDTPGGVSTRPCISSDETAFYFTRSPAGGNADIYVSYWIDDPYELAIFRIERAIEEKNEALMKIDTAMNEESQAYEALEELLLSGEYGDLNRVDIIRAKWKILSAFWRQKLCRATLRVSIGRLEDALVLLGYEVAPQSWPEEPGGINKGVIQADINADGTVDFHDLAFLMNHWLDSYE